MTECINPVTLEIAWARLVSIVDEAAATFIRASFSTLAREANDFAVVLTDAAGRSIAQSSMSVPSFIGTLPASVRHFIERFSIAGMSDGDVFITNDPWKGTGHVHDVTVATPIFMAGKVIAFAAITSHMPDIGGRLRSAGVREIYEEGLQIPLLKLVEAGRTNEAVVAFIETNVRVPDATMGDIWSEVAACRKVAERLVEVLGEVGLDLDDISAEVRTRSEQAMRGAIAALPDGRHAYSLLHDGFEDRVRIEATVAIDGDRIHIDYTGTSEQLARAVNVVPIYTFAYTAYAVKALLSPDIPNNEGSFQPVTTWAPEGTILNPRFPAPGGARNMIGHLLPAVVMGALAPILPDRIWAPGASNSSVTIAGEHNRQRYAGMFFFNGGQGASSRHAGMPTLSFPSNLANTPIEVIEQTVPVRILHRRRRPGSGGAGFRRGGDGLDVAFEFIGDAPATCSVILTRWRIPPPGLNGGEAGAIARLSVNGQTRDPAEPLLLHRDDRVTIETAGGGGLGVQEDVQ
ncbi:5-oxoprolinase [Mesorhizobium sp. Root102]|uniref:hydantoinase B/oxoprolinase family protein n=1 Tax=Mesorhizobium sp. Root102 TaxID=1736422 RepID=UPI0006FAF96D|nr:hydantoinase B/oxoprolinase family protein [Mesorhizobium sp. Root102]KQU80095.1 5-oxoprolinase [Mesorhizobium sp. Root102]